MSCSNNQNGITISNSCMNRMSSLEAILNSNSNRTPLNEKDIAQKYTFKPLQSDNIFKGANNYLKKNYTPSKACCWRVFNARLPVVSWLTKYNIRNNLLKDVIGGVTIGIIEIPQSKADIDSNGHN